jgi:hypothetical protein
MKQSLLVIVRNCDGQLLVVENKDGVCSFPGLPLEATESPYILAARLIGGLGFNIGGLTMLRETLKFRDTQVKGLSAYVTSTSRSKAPLNPEYRSLSWVAPSLLDKVSTLTDASKAFLEPVRWVGGVTP